MTEPTPGAPLDTSDFHSGPNQVTLQVHKKSGHVMAVEGHDDTSYAVTYVRADLAGQPQAVIDGLHEKLEYVALTEPGEDGEEFLRAALDDSGQLILSLATGPLADDAELWGVFLADVARQVARVHMTGEQTGSKALEATFETGDRSEEDLNLVMIQKRFHEEMKLEGVGVGAISTVFPYKLQNPRPVEMFSKGDRFILDGEMFMILASDLRHVEATNLVTADVRSFAKDTPVHPVRVKRA